MKSKTSMVNNTDNNQNFLATFKQKGSRCVVVLCIASWLIVAGLVIFIGVYFGGKSICITSWLLVAGPVIFIRVYIGGNFICITAWLIALFENPFSEGRGSF